MGTLTNADIFTGQNRSHRHTLSEGKQIRKVPQAVFRIGDVSDVGAPEFIRKGLVQ
jgi:hypothetical protein